VAGRFARVEALRRARQLIPQVAGRPAPQELRTIAEHVGNATPHGLQHLLGRARWDADLVRDDLRDFVWSIWPTSRQSWW
jgi:SRSO17 transposase